MRSGGPGQRIARLLLPFLLAAGGVGLLLTNASRSWRSLPSAGPQLAATAPGADRTEPEAGVEPAPTEEAPPNLPTESPERPAPAATGLRDTAARPPLPAREEESKNCLGPAPETVAPSTKAVLRISQPPPAAASAPRPAPAPSSSLTPAPEPETAPPPPPPPPPAPRQPLRQAWSQESVRAVRFDAGYYYGRGQSARQLADELVRSWSENGVNLVYFYAYNRVYGARYVTRYSGNIMEDYGRQDLLRHVLTAAHRRGIKVIAWFYGPQHKQMWEAHPEWRTKTPDGKDYKPDPDSYFLCVRNPQVMKWWLGLMDDLLTNYPELDGIDVAECQVDLWGDHACYCDHCRQQFADSHPGAPSPGPAWRQFRADGLTQALHATIRLARSYGKETHVTTVFTARRDGDLMSPASVCDAIGFDLDRLLAGRDRPDVVQAELIWQQWAALYRDQKTFTPEWTCDAVEQARKMVRGRARLIAHVEVSDFGAGPLNGPDLGLTVAAAVRGAPDGIDIYDANMLAKTEGASQYLQMAWLNPSR